MASGALASDSAAGGIGRGPHLLNVLTSDMVVRCLQTVPPGTIAGAFAPSCREAAIISRSSLLWQHHFDETFPWIEQPTRNAWRVRAGKPVCVLPRALVSLGEAQRRWRVTGSRFPGSWKRVFEGFHRHAWLQGVWLLESITAPMTDHHDHADSPAHPPAIPRGGMLQVSACEAGLVGHLILPGLDEPEGGEGLGVMAQARHALRTPRGLARGRWCCSARRSARTPCPRPVQPDAA